MKKLKKYILFLSFLLSFIYPSLSRAQFVAYSYQIVLRTSVTGVRSANITATGAAFHQLTWNVTGLLNTCSVKVDSSADGITWGNGNVIAAQNCTVNSQALSASIIPNYIRINATIGTGGGALAAVLDGYNNDPTGGSGTTAFGNILSGTNTTAAMIVGSGASLTPSGTGQISSTSNFFKTAALAVAPSPLGADACTVGINPNNYVQDNAGNFEPLSGIDTTTTWTGFSTKGWLTYCRPVSFISGTRLSNYSANGAVNVFKTPNAATNASDTFGMQVQNNLVTGDAGAYTGQILGIYAETDITGTATSNAGSTQGQVAAGGLRGVVADSRTVGAASQATMFGVSGHYVKSGASTYNGDNGSFLAYCNMNNASGLGAAAICDDYYAIASFNASTAPNGSYAAFHALTPTVRFPTANYGLWIGGPWSSNSADFAIRVDGTVAGLTGKTLLNGPVWTGELLNINGGVIPVVGSLSLSGSLNTTQISNPGAGPGVSNTGTPGATSYTYKFALCDGNGACTAVSSASTTATGNATLDGVNFNHLTVASGVIGTTTSTVNFYRTASGGTPSSTGKIGSVAVTQNGLTTISAISFDDTGLAGDGTTPPSVNSTGGISIAGTSGIGLPLQKGVVRAVSQTASIGNTTILTVGDNDTSYLLTGGVYCHTAVATGTILLTISYTDISNTAQTITTSAVPCTTLGANSFALVNSVVQAKATTTISYSTTDVNSANYDVRIQAYQQGVN